MIQELRFWMALASVFAMLSLAGVAFSWALVPAPKRYHRTSFLEFPLPPDWSCDRQGTDTVCAPEGQQPFEALIIFTVKWRGPTDEWNQYLAHVSEPQRPSGDEDAPLSTVMAAGETQLGAQRWVDARHDSSEIRNYVTRYMATLTSNLAVLVTYSIHRRHVDEYDGILDEAVRGLTIYERPAGLN